MSDARVSTGYLENLVGQELMVQALTRPCYANECRQTGEPLESQGYLAFLGDAILKAVLSCLLVQRGFRKRGELTTHRSKLENEGSLAGIARDVGIQREVIRMKKMTDEEWGRSEESILAETLEAIVGAVYLESGYDQVMDVVGKLFESRLQQLEPCDL